jgi:hypothetical protein
MLALNTLHEYRTPKASNTHVPTIVTSQPLFDIGFLLFDVTLMIKNGFLSVG